MQRTTPSGLFALSTSDHPRKSSSDQPETNPAKTEKLRQIEAGSLRKTTKGWYPPLSAWLLKRGKAALPGTARKVAA